MVSFPGAGFVRIALVPKPMAAAVAVVELINVLRFIFGLTHQLFEIRKSFYFKYPRRSLRRIFAQRNRNRGETNRQRQGQ